jgi:cytochrome c
MRRSGLAAALLLAATPLAFAEGDAALGEKRFEECVACHALEKGKESVGPDLHGVFGREAGEVTDFRYSPALKRSGIVWSEQTIDTFIADLIAYLVKTFK